MEYREILPLPQLQPYIKFFWVLQGEDANPKPERIFPDGCLELIFHLKTSYRRFIGNDTLLQPSAFIFGQITQAKFFLPSPQTQILAIRFRAHGLAAFTPMPVHEFTNVEVSLENLWGNAGKELEEQINSLPVSQALQTLQQFLLKRLHKNKQQTAQAAIATISNAMLQTNATHSVEYWADAANLSTRQFNRNFRNIIGISPKEYLKILRFNQAIVLYKDESTESFAMLAHQCGYYDQAHFIKDFKDYTGTTPKGYATDSKTLVPL